MSCGQRSRRAGTQGESHRPGRRVAAPVVHSGDFDARGAVAGIDQAQTAQLTLVRSRIEEGHVIAIRAVFRLCRHLVHVGDEAVRRPNVGQGLQVEVRRQHQPPVAAPGADAFGQSFLRIPVLQVGGIKMCRPLRLQRQRDGLVGFAFVVNGIDAHVPGAIGVVDDAHETLPFGAGSGRNQWEVMRRLAWRRGRGRGWRRRRWRWGLGMQPLRYVWKEVAEWPVGVPGVVAISAPPGKGSDQMGASKQTGPAAASFGRPVAPSHEQGIPDGEAADVELGVHACPTVLLAEYVS